MRRIAATLAGLALVIIPSAIAMSSAGSAASSAQQNLTPVYYQQSTQNTAPQQFHRGRHCHHGQGGSQQPRSGGEPDV
jgi:hypothetical protein